MFARRETYHLSPSGSSFFFLLFLFSVLVWIIHTQVYRVDDINFRLTNCRIFMVKFFYPIPCVSSTSSDECKKCDMSCTSFPEILFPFPFSIREFANLLVCVINIDRLLLCQFKIKGWIKLWESEMNDNHFVFHFFASLYIVVIFEQFTCIPRTKDIALW